MSLTLRHEESLDWLCESTGCGYMMIDSQRRLTDANLVLSRLLGRPRTDLIGRLFTALFPQVDTPMLDRILDGRLDWARPKDATIPLNRQCDYDFRARPLGDRYEILVINVSEKQKFELEQKHLKATMAVSQELLRHKNEELDKSLESMARMNDKLAHLDDLKSEFLSNTSHELRTPLNTIIGSIQLIREGLCENREEEVEYMGTALEAAQRLLEVINDVLDSAKLRAGKMNFMIEDHRITDLFEETYSQIHPAAKQKGLRVVFDLPTPVDMHVRSDFEKAKQILVNLAGNAVKFTHDGEIRVYCEIDPDTPNMVRFTVTDTGIGIPPERQRTIFDAFTQVDGSATRRFEGTGLGLAITKNLVEMMGGTIWLNMNKNTPGTEVCFTLPLGANSQKNNTRFDDQQETDLPMTF